MTSGLTSSCKRSTTKRCCKLVLLLKHSIFRELLPLFISLSYASMHIGILLQNIGKSCYFMGIFYYSNGFFLHFRRNYRKAGVCYGFPTLNVQENTICIKYNKICCFIKCFSVLHDFNAFSTVYTKAWNCTDTICLISGNIYNTHWQGCCFVERLLLIWISNDSLLYASLHMNSSSFLIV